MPSWMVGIDIGGTFTDVAATEADTGVLHIAKVVSTPADPSRAVVAGLQRLFEIEPELRPSDITFFAHGTTVATNTLLEQKGARAGLLITRGFGAVYELRGGLRPTGPDLLDTFYEKPPALVRRRFTEEIDGRIAYDGTELEPLDEEMVREAVRRLRDRDVNSIAVCYLFSFMNPRHEQRTAEIQRLAVEAFRTVDAAGVARVDFLLDEAADRVFVNEINTMPGSLAFYLWEPVGLRFPNLLDRLIELARKRHRERQRTTFTYDSKLLQQFGRGAKGKAPAAPRLS